MTQMPNALEIARQIYDDTPARYAANEALAIERLTSALAIAYQVGWDARGKADEEKNRPIIEALDKLKLRLKKTSC